MRTEDKIKEFNDELRSIKTAYSQTAYDLSLYTYTIPVDPYYAPYFIDQTLTFTTEDNTNTLATIEGAVYERLPYEHGAKFYLYKQIGNNGVKLHSIQKGTAVLS